MRAGQLRHRLVIQVSALSEPDELGGRTESWSDVETIWARVQQAGGSERLAGRLAIAEASHLVTTRYTPNLNVKSRLAWTVAGVTRYLYPTAVDPDERRTMLTAACRELLA